MMISVYSLNPVNPVNPVELNDFPNTNSGAPSPE